MTHEKVKKQDVKYICRNEDDGKLLVDVLSLNSTISKSLLKKLMTNGSVFQSFKGSRRHARKAKNTVKAGDVLECFFDPSIDFEKEYPFKCLFENKNYGIYLKPAGARTEGTDYGDKTSLLRYVEKIKRYVYLVNRLDMEIEGLVVVAFNSKSQNQLQQIWRDVVVKKYQAIVLGEVSGSGYLDAPINNKYSMTSYDVIKFDGEYSYLEIEAKTERKHQIRLHLTQLGHPIIGDPLFGENNKNTEGLKLISYALDFIDPHNNKKVSVSLPKEALLFT